MACKATSEREWWNAHSDLVDYIWSYDDYLQVVVRGGYLAELNSFLFKPGGRLLDFGCGTAWASLPLAQRGMHLVGIDVSKAQITKACQQAKTLNLTNVSFYCADRIPDDEDQRYDSVLLHALLHHLPDNEKCRLLGDVARALVDGGRLYIYEPLAPKSEAPWFPRLVERVIGTVFRLTYFLAQRLRLYENRIGEAICTGWTMKSPDEEPLPLDRLLGLLPPTLAVTRISYWQCWAITYANFCMGLRPPWRNMAERLAPLFVGLDRIVLRTPMRDYLRGWPMVSILAEKRG
jgi:SAM-dependent methyltransferase